MEKYSHTILSERRSIGLHGMSAHDFDSVSTSNFEIMFIISLSLNNNIR